MSIRVYLSIRVFTTVFSQGFRRTSLSIYNEVTGWCLLSVQMVNETLQYLTAII